MDWSEHPAAVMLQNDVKLRLPNMLINSIYGRGVQGKVLITSSTYISYR